MLCIRAGAVGGVQAGSSFGLQSRDFQYFGHLMQRADSLGKTLMLGKIEGRRRRTTEDEMVGWHHRLDGHEFEQALRVGDGQGSLVVLQSVGSQRIGHN